MKWESEDLEFILALLLIDAICLVCGAIGKYDSRDFVHLKALINYIVTAPIMIFLSLSVFTLGLLSLS